MIFTKNLYKKNRLYLKIVSLLLLFNFKISIFSAFDDARLKLISEKNDKNILELAKVKNNSKNTATLNEKVDLLRVVNILDSKKLFNKEASIITENEWDELELDKFIENFEKYKKTKFDNWGLKNLLRYAPEGSKELIRFLAQNDEAFSKLNRLVEKVACAQDEIIIYWDEKSVLNNDSKKFYYSLEKVSPKLNNYLNSNEKILSFSHAFSLASPFISIIAFTGISDIVMNYALYKVMSNYGLKNNFGGLWKNIAQAIYSPIIVHSPFPYVYKNGYDPLILYQIGKFSFADNYIFFREFLNYALGDTGAIKSIFSGVTSGFCVFSMQAIKDYCKYVEIKKAIKEILFLRKITNQLQENLSKVSNMFETLNNFKEACPKNLQENSFVIRNIEKFLKKENMSEELGALIDNLSSYGYKLERPGVFNCGCLLKTHRLINNLKEEIIQLLQNNALLCAYRDIVQIVRDHKEARTKFCFVEFIESDSPVINFENAWMPLLKEEKVVLNDCRFGIQSCKEKNIELEKTSLDSFNGGIKNFEANAVVTGPNGGGKSTYMITTAFNVLLSKLGIAACDRAVMTDFEKIRTSLRPAQDITTGMSSFMAEQRRLEEVKRDINLCKGKILVLVDEPYKGTVEVESASRVYDFGMYVAQNCKNAVVIMATHLRKPIELDQDTQGVFKNYQLGYLQKGDSEFERTFKVQDGAAIWWFDDANKRSKFINWLCENEIKN